MIGAASLALDHGIDLQRSDRVFRDNMLIEHAMDRDVLEWIEMFKIQKNMQQHEGST